uniref:HAT C-terminal dimerisation domain-containing protein n=1 Tax=Latimeria chalumnae TaxID=7897 RepID=H3A376_LATCH
PLNEVRWLSKHFAISASMRNSELLVEYCIEQVNKSSDPIHKYCLKKLKHPQYHIALAILNDVLGELAELCKVFQRSSLTTTEAHQFAKPKISKLHAQYLSETVYWRVEVKALLAATETVDTTSIVCIHLDSRFPEDELKEWAAFDQAALAHADFDFGRESVARLVTKYAGVIEKPEINIHTEILKQYSDFTERIKTEAVKSFADLVSFLLQEEHFSDLSKLLDVCVTFQACSADCECGFSMMNVIKTKSRNRLEVDHLDKLMRIKSYLTAGGEINLDTV